MGIGCGVGYAWLMYNYNSYQLTNSFTVCIIKNVTGIPCPSCGSTRAVESLINGNLVESILWNPIGLLLVTMLVIIPIWILLDLFRKKDSLYQFYHSVEIILKQKKYAIPAILLVVANWVWNIYKDL